MSAKYSTVSTATLVETVEPSSLVDANLVLWAHHRGFPRHEEALSWWAEALSSKSLIGVTWPTTLAFVRISTNPRVFEQPLTLADAWATVETWLDRSNVWVPVPTERHRGLLGEMLLGGQANRDLSSDAHLAALAIEWGLELLTADADFDRFPGLRWRNPLAI